MLFYVMLLFFSVALVLTLLHNLHRLFALEATSRCGGTILLDGSGNVGLSDIVAAIFHSKIKLCFYRGVDANTSIPFQTYKSAKAPHPPVAQDWENFTDAALSSTREVTRNFKHNHDPYDGIRLYTFIQLVGLSTILRIFFHLPVTPTNMEEVVWIVTNAWQTVGNCWEEAIGSPPEL